MTRQPFKTRVGVNKENPFTSKTCERGLCIKPFPQTSSNTVNMSLKVSAVDQLCKYELLKGGNGAGIETELALKIIHKALGQDHISYTQCGRNCLRKGVHIDHVIIIGKQIQSFLWLWGNRKL